MREWERDPEREKQRSWAGVGGNDRDQERGQGRDGGRWNRDWGGGQGPRGRAGSAQSTRAHVLQHAVGSSKHPPLVDQHASTVELIAVEQGHLPGLGAS